MHVESMESLTPRRGPTPRLNFLCLHRSAWKHWQVRHRSMGVPLCRWMVYKGKSQSKMDWLSRENLHRKPWIFSHEDHGRFSGSKRFPKPIHWNIRHQITYKVVTVTTKYVFNCYPTDGFLSKHMQRETDCQIVTPNILRAFNIWIYFRDVIHVSPQSMGVLRFYQQELGIEQCHKPPIGADLEYHFSNKMWEGVWWWVYHMIPFPQIWLNFNIQNPKWIDWYQMCFLVGRVINMSWNKLLIICKATEIFL